MGTDLQMNGSDFTRMGGYQDDNSSNGHQGDKPNSRLYIW